MLSPDVFKKGFCILSIMKGVPSALDEEKDDNFIENRKMLYRLMSDLDDDAFENAVNRIAREDDFFPSPARIIKLAKGNKYPTPEEAWALVKSRAHDYSRDDVTDMPPIVQKAVSGMGGMRFIKDQNFEEEEQWVRKSFIDCYDNTRKAAEIDPSTLQIGTQKKSGSISMGDGLKEIGVKG